MKEMSTDEIVVEVKVDGRNMVLNRFVQKIVSNVTVGIVNSLRDVNDWKEATVRIRRK